MAAAAAVAPAPASGQQLDPRLLSNRVQVIDRMAAPFPNAAAASGFVARFLGGDPWAAFSSCIGEQTARGEWLAAVDEARRLLDDAADQLVPLPPRSPLIASVTSTPVREVVYGRLKRLPPTVTASFRKTADAAAQKLLQAWRITGATEPLRRAVREFGISPHAREAADVLGDLAFEAGELDAAFAWWNAKLADAGDGDRARRRAKQILATIFLHRFTDAERAIEQLTRDHPASRGPLAGRDGAYSDILTHWLGIRRAIQSDDRDGPWPTLAGDAARNRVLAEPLPQRLWTEGHTWRASALVNKRQRAEAVFPLIRDGQVFFASQEEVASHDLATGAVRFRYRDPDAAGRKPAASAPILLHAAPGCIYAATPPALVCLDTAPDVPKTGMLLWRVSARDPDGQPATFTSGPLLAGNRLFAVLSTTAGVRAEHYLASYTTRRGVRLWCTPLYEGPADAAPARLLTWAGDRVIYATHQGQIIAADPATGQPLWSVRYPSRTLRASPLGPLPAIYDAGHVVVAPRDAPLLLCIDSATGRVMWELPVDNITSLAGVSDGMVVFTTRHGIEAVDLVSGGGARSWRQPSGGRLPTAGRGLLAGPLLYWPTHDERLPLRTLEIATGSSFPSNFSLRLDPSRFHPLPPGNFAFGERSLAIGTRDELVVFTPRQAKPPAAE